MKYYAYLQRFYQLYANILFKCPANTFLKVFVSLFSYFHFFVISFDIHTPTLLLNINSISPIIYHIQSIFYFLPWVYGVWPLLLDGVLLFIINIISFIIILHARTLLSNGKCVSHWTLVFIQFYQTVFIPVYCYPLFFRVSLIIELLISDRNLKIWFSFVICLFNIFFFIIHLFLESVFLSFIVFLPKSRFDTYDGKSNLILYLFRFFFSVGIHLIDMTNNILIASLVSVIFLIMSIYLFYKRVLLTIHFSLFSEYLEISPFFTISITNLVHVYIKEYRLLFLTIFIVHIIVLILLLITHQYLTKESFQFFIALKKGDDLAFSGPLTSHILLKNIVSILRQIFLKSGDPTVFMNILLQRQYDIKASPMIEIIRFLSIFPSKRVEMITELSHIKSGSNYNRFIIYFFLKTLKSLTTASDEKHTLYLDELQRSFLVHHHTYWKFREKGKYFRAFKEACATSYYFIETKYEIISLIERFPFDSYLYTRYAEFVLIGCGDFEQYNKSMLISSNLETNCNLVSDPILRKTIKNNVQILQFCNPDELILSNPNPLYSSNDNDVPIASYVKPSKRMIPFFPFIHAFISIILFLIYFSFSIPFESYSKKNYEDINSEFTLLGFLYKKTASLMLCPYAISESTSTNFTKIQNETICQESFDSIYRYMYSFYSSIPQIQTLYNYSINFYKDYFYENMVNNKTACQCLNNLTFAFYCLLDDYLIELYNQLKLTDQLVKKLDNRINKEMRSYLIEIVVIVIIICTSIIYIIVLIIQINWVFRKNTNVIRFLASKKRVTSLFLKQCVESWDDLYNYIHSRRLYIHHLKVENPENPRIASLSRLSSTSSSMNLNEIEYSSFDEDTTSSLSTSNTSTQISMSGTDDDNHDYSLSSSSIENNEKNIPYEKVDESEVHLIQDDFNQNNDFAENDEDAVELTIEATMQQRPFTWISVPLFLILPNIITIVTILIFMIPTTLRMQLERNLIDDYLASCSQINLTFNLVENTYFLLKGTIDHSPTFYNSIHTLILEEKTNITDIFTQNQCLQLDELVCLSYSQLVIQISSIKPTYENLLLLYLPAFIDFGMNAISVTFSDINDPYFHIPTSSMASFFIDFIVVGLIFAYFDIIFSGIFVSSFNSLFHFPECFLKKKNKKKKKNKNLDNNDENDILYTKKENNNQNNKNVINDLNNPPIQFLPSVVLTVVSVFETDEIYSISENAAIILNRPVPSFIGEKFNQVFTLIQGNDQQLNSATNTTSSSENTNFFYEIDSKTQSIDDFILPSKDRLCIQLREHLMPDRVKKKIFRSSTRKKGEFLITLLVEDEIQVNMKPAYKQESISERLMSYVPIYFAKLFSDGSISNISIDFPLLIFLRFDTSKAQADLERFFAMINTCIMNYTSFKTIKADGGIFLFCTMKKINKLIAYLFIRDIISEGANFARSQPTKAPISVYVEVSDILSIELDTENEPCLDIGIDQLNDYEALLFGIEKNRVAFNCDFDHPLDVIDDLSTREHIQVNGLSRNIKWLPFDKYMELFKKYL